MPPHRLRYAVGTAHPPPTPSSFVWEEQPELNLDGIESAAQLKERVLQQLQLESCIVFCNPTRFGFDGFAHVTETNFSTLEDGDRLYIDDTKRFNLDRLTHYQVLTEDIPAVDDVAGSVTTSLRRVRPVAVRSTSRLQPVVAHIISRDNTLRMFLRTEALAPGEWPQSQEDSMAFPISSLIFHKVNVAHAQGRQEDFATWGFHKESLWRSSGSSGGASGSIHRREMLYPDIECIVKRMQQQPQPQQQERVAPGSGGAGSSHAASASLQQQHQADAAGSAAVGAVAGDLLPAEFQPHQQQQPASSNDHQQDRAAVYAHKLWTQGVHTIAIGELKPGILLAKVFGYSSVQSFRDAVISGSVTVDLPALYNENSPHTNNVRNWVDQAFEYAVEAGAPVVVIAMWDLWFFGFRTGGNGFELEIWGPVVTHQSWSDGNQQPVTVRGTLSYLSEEGSSMPRIPPASPPPPRHGRITRSNSRVSNPGGPSGGAVGPGGTGADAASVAGQHAVAQQDQGGPKATGLAQQQAKMQGGSFKDGGTEWTSGLLQRCKSPLMFRDATIKQLSDQGAHLMYPLVSKDVPYVHMHDLNLGDVVHHGRFAVLCEGTWGSSPAVFKILMPDGWQPVDSFVHERVMYSHLQSLQGGAVPQLLAHGLTFCASRYFMALERVPGVSLERLSKPLPGAICTAAEAALDAVHSCGVIHGDLHAGNVMVCHHQAASPWVVLIDFEHAQLAASVADAAGCMIREKQLLQDLLR